MKLMIGNTLANSLMFRDRPVSRLYKGSTLIYERENLDGNLLKDSDINITPIQGSIEESYADKLGKYHWRLRTGIYSNNTFRIFTKRLKKGTYIMSADVHYEWGTNYFKFNWYGQTNNPLKFTLKEATDVTMVAYMNSTSGLTISNIKLIKEKGSEPPLPPVPPPPPLPPIVEGDGTLSDSDIIMTPKYPSISTVEKRGEFSRYVSVKTHNDINIYFTIFDKILPKGRYEFSFNISNKQGNVYGVTPEYDLYSFDPVRFDSDGINSSKCNLGMKSNSSCVISNMALRKVGDIAMPRPPFINPNMPNAKEVYINKEDGKRKTIIWTAGLKNPPKMGGENPDFRRTEIDGHVSYETGYPDNREWFDASKDPDHIGDDHLCFVSTAVNSLYWWLEMNRPYIERFIREGGVIPKDPHGVKMNILKKALDSPVPQLHSVLWDYVAGIFMGRDEGGHTDCVIDQFINGYWIDNPKTTKDWVLNSETNQGLRLLDEGVDPKGGFFNEVFDIRRLTERRYYEGQHLKEYTNFIKETLEHGGIVGTSIIIPAYGNAGHIVTMWGAEFDEDGSLSAVFVSDSDDQSIPFYGMDRRMIGTSSRGQITLTTRKDRKGGTPTSSLNTLLQGKEFWENYFKNNKNNDIL